MKPIQFTAKCDQTIERFKKKKIVAICIEDDTRLNPRDKFNIFNSIIDKTSFKLSRFNSSLYLGVGAMNNMSNIDVMSKEHYYEKELIDLAKYYKDKNINHFVNNWIEDNYNRDCILVDAKYIEQYSFLFKVNAFIIKVKADKENRNLRQPLIPEITKPNFTLSVLQLDSEKTIQTLIHKINNFMDKKEEKIKLPKIKKNIVLYI